MNKLFIGLLIVAAGAGIFFVLRKKKNSTKNSINKEWIVGKWKADAGKDSAFSQYSYDFLKEGNIVRSLSDSAKADTIHYEWNKSNELVWRQKAGDSTSMVLTIVKLTKDSLQVKSKDSVQILFTKTIK